MRRNIRICPHTTKRAFAISRDAAALGFDWPTAADVVDKLQEEVDEIRDALAKPQYDSHLADEIGARRSSLRAMSELAVWGVSEA